MANQRRVVVTGLGALTPIGNDVSAYWKALLSGKSGAAPITRFDASSHQTRFACELKGYDPIDFFNAKEIRRMDRFTQYALVVADQAVKDANIEHQVNPKRVGVIWGSGVGGLGTTEDTVLDFRYGCARVNPFFIPKIIPDIPAGHISIRYGFQGPNFATVSACASSLHALISGSHLIQLNQADVVVAGGSEAPIIPIGVAGFNALQALSERNEDYLTASRPFDETRDGFVMGEGGGAVVLESYDHAQKRGAKVYAEMVGTASSADAYHITAPDVGGVALVLERVLENAHLTPDCIGYINAHGTSTLLGDRNEIKALQTVFGDAIYQLNISATKSMTGDRKSVV